MAAKQAATARWQRREEATESLKHWATPRRRSLGTSCAVKILTKALPTWGPLAISRLLSSGILSWCDAWSEAGSGSTSPIPRSLVSISSAWKANWKCWTGTSPFPTRSTSRLCFWKIGLWLRWGNYSSFSRLSETSLLQITSSRQSTTHYVVGVKSSACRYWTNAATSTKCSVFWIRRWKERTTENERSLLIYYIKRLYTTTLRWAFFFITLGLVVGLSVKNNTIATQVRVRHLCQGFH